MTTHGKFDDYVNIAIKDSGKASEVVAKSFYKILRKNGFNDNQIISVANNILDCLIQTLESYKERTVGTPDHQGSALLEREESSAPQESVDSSGSDTLGQV